LGALLGALLGAFFLGAFIGRFFLIFGAVCSLLLPTALAAGSIPTRPKIEMAAAIFGLLLLAPGATASFDVAVAVGSPHASTSVSSLTSVSETRRCDLPVFGLFSP